MNPTESKSTFSNHVQELRKRVGISMLVIILASIITFIFHKNILEFLIPEVQTTGYRPTYTKISKI